ARLDAERRAGGGQVRGPLHGIPVLVKDNIATADRLQTTAGSLALVGATPPRDAAVVRRLREAGAVIIGKTNLSEWANFRSSQSSSGWGGRGGQGRNPYALDRNPCGSSPGTGTAGAANPGADPEDAVTASGPGINDYTKFLDADGLKGATIGVARNKLMGYHPATDLLVAQALDVLRQQGATIVDPADIPHLGEYDDAELTVLLYEFK